MCVVDRVKHTQMCIFSTNKHTQLTLIVNCITINKCPLFLSLICARLGWVVGKGRLKVVAFVISVIFYAYTRIL